MPRFREDLATTHINLSYLLNDLGRNDEAGAAAESALAGWDGLLRGPLVHPRYYAGAATSLLARAQVLSDLACDADAERDLTKAIDWLQKVVHSQPIAASASHRYYLAVTRSHLGRVLHKQKEHARAQQAFQAAIEDLKSLLGEVRDRPDLANALAPSYNHLGDLWRDMEQTSRAAAAYGEARRLWEALARESDLPEYHYQLAWFLATCADPARRDPASAEALAIRARDQAQENARYWNALGVALYRAGKHDAAVAALLTAAAHRTHAHGLDWFFLAAAYAKQGEKQAAREANERAVQWMEKDRPGNVELRAIHEEVAPVLQAAGIAADGPQCPHVSPGALAKRPWPGRLAHPWRPLSVLAVPA